ncbi:hypothetical protein PENSPDRAFT_89278 [Peniophora sp. CONT]|nr:hypothetical protein PENSPDRAFT_89278 [Peniophora sp. CONT]
MYVSIFCCGQTSQASSFKLALLTLRVCVCSDNMSISPSTKRLKPKPSGCGICSELTDSRVRRHGLDTPPNALLLATVARKARVYLHMNGALTAHLATCICLAGTIVSTTIKQKRPVIGAPYLQPGYKASWTVSSGPPFHSPSLDYYLVYLNSLSELFLVRRISE